MPSDKNLLDQYLAAGWYVFPCPPKDKTPFAGSHGCLDATNNREIVDEIWGKSPDNNVALACGPSRLVVVDIDNAESWDVFLNGRLEPDTLVNKTSRGYQLVFKANGTTIKNSVGKLAPGVDVRAQGGYILVEPSVHPSGTVYAWQDGFDPGRIAPLPAWLAELLAENEKPKQAEPVEGTIPEGKRNETLFSLAGTMRRRGCQEPEIFAALVEINKRCNPPLSENELHKLVKSVEKYAPAAPLFAPAAVEPAHWESLVFTPSVDNCPDDSKTLLELANTRILSRGNIALLSAVAGCGKSSVLEAACASIYNAMGDNLGLVVSTGSLLFIDTERSRHDFHHAWQRYRRRSGMTESQAAVQWQNIRSIDSVSDRLEYLWSRIDRDNAPELVFIDGIGDFVKNVNDSDEVTPIVNRLLSITDRRNIGILLTLHVNPGLNSEKARGVLGSELWRKAESVLIIEKTPGEDTRRLTTDYNLGKNRSGSDKTSSFFRWDDTEKMHVSCDKPAEAKGKTVCNRERAIKIVAEKSSWSYTELWTAISEGTGKAERTAKLQIKELLSMEKIVKNSDGTYSSAEKKSHEQPDYIQN